MPFSLLSHFVIFKHIPLSDPVVEQLSLNSSSAHEVEKREMEAELKVLSMYILNFLQCSYNY